MFNYGIKALVTATFLALALLPATAFGDTLFLSPLKDEYTYTNTYMNTYRVGQTFTVEVLASSPNQSVNAASGVLTFPTDKLEVSSISTEDSILSLWIREPSFSNTEGTVTFEGILPTPGFTGSNGLILTVTFRAKGAGLVKMGWSEGLLLANDGYGTNVLRTLGTTNFYLW